MVKIEESTIEEINYLIKEIGSKNLVKESNKTDSKQKFEESKQQINLINPSKSLLDILDPF